jgi:integrase
MVGSAAPLLGSPGGRYREDGTSARERRSSHAYATRLLEGGVHPKVVSEALGHSSISITMDTYSHVMPSMSQVAADAIDAVLGQ